MANPNPAPHRRFGQKTGNQGAAGPGRPGQVYTKRMVMLADLAAKSKRMEQVLRDPEAPLDDFLKVFDRVSDRAHGKPVQPSNLSVGGLDGAPLVVEFVHQRPRFDRGVLPVPVSVTTGNGNGHG